MKEEEETWHSYKTKKKKLPYVQTQAEEAERERAVDGGGGMDSRRTCVDVIWSSVMHWERKRWEERGWRRAPQGGPTVGARGLIPKTAVFTGEGGQRPGPCEMGALFGLVRMTLCSLCTLCWWYTPSISTSVGVWRLKLVWFSLRCIHKLNFTRCSCKKNKNIGKTLTFSDRFCVFVAHCWPTLIEPLEMQLTPVSQGSFPSCRLFHHLYFSCSRNNLGKREKKKIHTLLECSLRVTFGCVFVGLVFVNMIWKTAVHGVCSAVPLVWCDKVW